jgi:hypothetical protein
MRKTEVQIGHVYVAKISNQLTEVRIERPSPFGGWEARNINTGRTVRIKSAAKLRSEVVS